MSAFLSTEKEDSLLAMAADLKSSFCRGSACLIHMLLASLATSVFTTTVFAQDPDFISRPLLVIFCEGFSQKTPQISDQNKDEVVCAKVKKNIESESDFGQSPFASVEVAPSSFEADHLQNDKWLLKVSSTSESTSVQLFANLFGSVIEVSDALVFPLSRAKSQRVFKDSLKIRIILNGLLSTSVFRSSVLGRDLMGKISNEEPQPALNQSVIDKVAVFSIYLDRELKLLRPEIIAMGARKNAAKSGAKWSYESNPSAKIDSESYYFVQDYSGRELDMKNLVKGLNLNSIPKRIKRKVHRDWSVSIRYGHAVSRKESMLSNPIWSITAESRSGFMDGFRFSYDLLPLSKKTDSNYDYQLKWSRLQLGYSVGRSLKLPLINWIDIAPRIGALNFQLGVESKNSTLPSTDYATKNALALGVEGGIESRLDFVLVRFWTLINRTFGVSRTAKTSIFQYRFGADLWKDIFELTPEKRLSAVAFYAYESTRIKQVGGGEDQLEVKGINYSNSWMGLGIGVTW